MQCGMPPPGFRDRRGKTIADRARGYLPVGFPCSESSLLAALGDAGAEILRDGGSIPPTSTHERGPSGPLSAYPGFHSTKMGVLSPQKQAVGGADVSNASHGATNGDQFHAVKIVEAFKGDPLDPIDGSVDLGDSRLPGCRCAVDEADRMEA